MKTIDTKLTLKLDQGVIRGAKAFARSKGLSLSRMVESYFKSLSRKADSKGLKPSPLVDELSGIIQLPKDFDAKKAYGSYLAKKYAK